MTTIDRIFISIFVIVIVAIGGFMAMFFAALSGMGTFYLIFIVAAIALFIALALLRIFTVLTTRQFNLTLASGAAVCGLVLAGYEINKAYLGSITMKEQEVDLNAYKPFMKSTKAVALEEPSSFKLEKDLPRLDGATALYPLYAAIAQAVYPQADYDISNSAVMSSKTDGAYEKLIRGEVDIIFTAGPSRLQRLDAERSGRELVLTPIGREAFVFFVNSRNRVKDVTLEQIQSIYSGHLTNWQELGGDDMPIQAFQRPENSGSQSALQKLMEGKNLVTPPQEDVASGMGGIIRNAANYRNHKNAVGYSFLFYATEMTREDKIRLLSINGVQPNRANIQNQSYPLTSEFYAVTLGSKNPNVEGLIEWILSPQGQSLVDKTGYTPLKK
ncbi:PstS family phosphate ABC transporter substrate-binding protein [Paenibacillus lutrae]|uniref:PBP domain-containing protein n=1 Tax=Paenibacillus lutrae TaxID=2078573 RepID=A0A7X3FIU5_9BACL|nr:substrate-binding domain-containing protein [Paenibacillus lutrae]MVP00569.1 hypothetical protein [Paenibacillus lutrae]